MKAAIVYYSQSGNTAWTAKEIAGKTGADLIEIVPQKEYPSSGFRKFFWGGKSAVMGDMPPLQPYRFDADAYDTVILGTPVWASRITPPLKTFVNDNLAALQNKKLAVFTCFSGGGAEKAIDALKKQLGVSGFAAELILVDPLSKPKSDTNGKIESFCRALTEI